jgi:cytochrome c oxidase assembly protein subunit 15
VRATDQPELRDPGPWPGRCALASVLFAVPLVLFGGSVTTLGAGMAVEGWLVAEGHFLLFFPIERWFRDTATFVEHTHRLFGVLVGFSALACVVLAFLREPRRGPRLGALAALAAVCAQGALGGFRVLENDPELAFLHGAVAQLVFALLCVNAVLFTRGWRSSWAARARERGVRRAFASAAMIAFVATSAQVALGAWYRHGLRPAPVAGIELRLLLHGLGALVVLMAVAALARRGAALRAEADAVPATLGRALQAVPVLLLAQLVLGGLAWAGFRPDTIGPAEWAFSITHVLGGALLLGAEGVLVLWGVRLARAAEPVLADEVRAAPVSSPRSSFGEAR